MFSDLHVVSSGRAYDAGPDYYQLTCLNMAYRKGEETRAWIHEYFSDHKKQRLLNNEDPASIPGVPHIWTMAQKVWSRLDQGKDQTVAIMGTGGSGKSFQMYQLVSFLNDADQGGTAETLSMLDTLKTAERVFEAFGGVKRLDGQMMQEQRQHFHFRTMYCSHNALHRTNLPRLAACFTGMGWGISSMLPIVRSHLADC